MPAEQEGGGVRPGLCPPPPSGGGGAHWPASVPQNSVRAAAGGVVGAGGGGGGSDAFRVTPHGGVTPPFGVTPPGGGSWTAAPEHGGNMAQSECGHIAQGSGMQMAHGSSGQMAQAGAANPFEEEGVDPYASACHTVRYALINKPVKARFWPWLQPFSVRMPSKSFSVVPSPLGSGPLATRHALS